jgi:hypothetical protein
MVLIQALFIHGVSLVTLLHLYYYFVQVRFDQIIAFLLFKFIEINLNFFHK